ncbi:MAG: hypothetical protein JW874_07975 [Spirochaetales bacterium]|nr:hypothetical protein [Spirochaetales bacterium]
MINKKYISFLTVFILAVLFLGSCTGAAVPQTDKNNSPQLAVPEKGFSISDGKRVDGFGNEPFADNKVHEDYLDNFILFSLFPLNPSWLIKNIYHQYTGIIP